MVQIEFLTTEELDKLRQFMEITNIDDDDRAYELLSSTQWNVEQALETFLMLGSDSNGGGAAVGYEGFQLDPVDRADNLTAEVHMHDVESGNNEGHDDAADDEGESSDRDRPKAESLISHDEQTIPAALVSFVTNFELRYCSDPSSDTTMPHFFTESLEAAIEAAFNEENGKPLLFFINNESSDHTKLFIRFGLCNDYICDLLKNNFILFPWDVTEMWNMNRFLQMLQNTNLICVHDVVLQYTRSSLQHYPLMIVVSKKRNTFEVIGTINGSTDLSNMINILHEGFQQFKADHNVRVAENRRRRHDREILDKQNAEYQQSLMADLRRKQEKQRQEEEEIRIKNEMEEKEEKDRQRMENAAAKVPVAPELFGPSAVSIKFRLPEGFQDTRLFYKTNKLQSLIDYLESKRFFSDEFTFLNSDFPKKDITKTYDLEKTFEEVNWPGKETIFVNSQQ